MGSMKDKLGDIPYSPVPVQAFDGATYEAGGDYLRLTGQLARVYSLMKDGQWRSLQQIADVAGGSEAACSARLRDLRKPKYGAHNVLRTRVTGGLWRYRMVSRNA
ncbi:hypothetical protein [Bradyrhizobium sp. 1(2017)]|jgi:hypothetical protein|uniref:hypothetical protein n=1 Tax=Bradyrhizobium sp. 1(2017) TaxID=1404888 RepID=UPI00140EE146|nr:hypothetical protein [Bradyrhizobium sp. 1(2017)]QIO34346.1 hypothetical protein HAP40_22380 [Bradyrhizobium sp. 1(2017)]